MFNGEILQEPNNVGALNESDVRLDTHIPVAEVIRIIWWQYEGNFVFGLQIVWKKFKFIPSKICNDLLTMKIFRKSLSDLLYYSLHGNYNMVHLSFQFGRRRGQNWSSRGKIHRWDFVSRDHHDGRNMHIDDYIGIRYSR